MNFLRRTIYTGLKYTLYTIGSIVLSVSCQSGNTNISGYLTDGGNDTLLFFIDNMYSQKRVCIDTVGMKNGQFEVQVPDSALSIFITPKPKSPNGAIRMASGRPIMFFPGDQLKIEGTTDSFTVIGSELYDGLNQLEEMYHLGEQLDKINQEYRKAFLEKDSLQQKMAEKIYKTKHRVLQKMKLAAIKAHRDYMAAGYLAMELNAEMGLEAINHLSDEVKNGPLAKHIEKCRISCEKQVAKNKRKEDIKCGKQAPDFRLKSLDGKEVSLSSFNGKYLLLDFWATWCGWCMKELPEMKEYYEKYKDKVEFLGICCDDSEEKWQKSVTKEKMPWKNAIKGSSEIDVLYAIEGFPTKVLIDPQGRIVEIFIGVSGELKQKLEELF